MNKTRNSSLLIFVLVILQISACRPESVILPGSTNINTKITGKFFQPATWRVPAGQKITLTITNEDKIVHDWTIMTRPSPLPFSKADEPNVFFQHLIEPGNSISIEFTAPQSPGEYQVISSQRGDGQAGLVGALVVVSVPK
jgi:plastocyanin